MTITNEHAALIGFLACGWTCYQLGRVSMERRLRMDDFSFHTICETIAKEFYPQDKLGSVKVAQRLAARSMEEVQKMAEEIEK